MLLYDMDGLAIYHKMYCNLEFIFIHSNQSENAKVIVTFDNRIYLKKEKKEKKAAKTPFPESFFKCLQCCTKNSNVYERSHAFLPGLIIWLTEDLVWGIFLESGSELPVRIFDYSPLKYFK